MFIWLHWTAAVLKLGVVEALLKLTLPGELFWELVPLSSFRRPPTLVVSVSLGP